MGVDCLRFEAPGGGWHMIAVTPEQMKAVGALLATDSRSLTMAPLEVVLGKGGGSIRLRKNGASVECNWRGGNHQDEKAYYAVSESARAAARAEVDGD